MKLLFLGTEDNPLTPWLKAEGENVFIHEEALSDHVLESLKPDLIVSYNYRHILRENHLSFPRLGSINLHISYLPWNRGADPNPWSHLTECVTGVTIHKIDAGVDTGDILLQHEVFLNDEMTLKESYAKLHEEICVLFKQNWNELKQGLIVAKPQPEGGSLHYVKDREKFSACLGEEGWDVAIKDFRERYRKQTAECHENR